MTNQEAIMRIKEHVRIHQICEPRAIKISEALDTAIKALEATSPCDLCVYNPPSRYGKPCSCCPAESYREEK